ncbi:cytochrome c [Lysinibacillus macroides]|nr:cytochrome c [Lysinibacillus macroides]
MLGGETLKQYVKFFIVIGTISATLLTACSSNEQQAELDADLVAEGEKIAKSSCIGCHAADLSGDMGPNLRQLKLSKEEIVEVLEKGRGSMPPATAKGHEEAVAEYLLSLQ